MIKSTECVISSCLTVFIKFPRFLSAVGPMNNASLYQQDKDESSDALLGRLDSKGIQTVTVTKNLITYIYN